MNFSDPEFLKIVNKFKSDKLAMFGVIIILCALVISILGASIRPDGSYKSNFQCLEIAVKHPGFSQKFFKIKYDDFGETNSLWVEVLDLFRGHKIQYKFIPINSFRFEDDHVVLNKYTGFYGDSTLVKYYIYDFFDTGLLDLSPLEIKEKISKENIVTKYYLLGTDKYGRDVLSRLMSGTWVSLAVGFISVMVSLVIGLVLGACAGFFGGKVDAFISWFFNVIWSIPTLLLIISITIVLGKNIWQIFIAVGLTMWIEIARVVRGQVMSIKEMEYIEATHSLGYSNMRIIFKHIFPNIIGPVIVLSAINFASAILIEAGLSYLGIGVQSPQSSWGKMISDHKGYIVTEDAYLAIVPGLVIMFMVLSFVFVGNGIRDALDSKSIKGINTI